MTMNMNRLLIASLLALPAASATHAAATSEEVKGLGAALTPFGAEVAANKANTIPAYTGAALAPPAGFVHGSGKYPSPFADEKPLYSITGKNMGKYADILSEANKVLLKRYPAYRIDVYPSHRTVSYPKFVLDNSIKNASQAKLSAGGIEGAYGGVPFPVPKNGNEAMWNFLLRYSGHAYREFAQTWYVDNSGRAIMTSDLDYTLEYPYFNPKKSLEQYNAGGKIYYRIISRAAGPARSVGDGNLIIDRSDDTPRRAWSYTQGQRRVRVSPDNAYDTPILSKGGVINYDEANIFSGKQDRFNFKLVGKKELLIPYSNYKMVYETPIAKVMTPNFINPDVTRWELHRVWVVEATVKPGVRHVYPKRVFYFDEDWGSASGESFDGAGTLVKALFGTVEQLYDVQAPNSRSAWYYDLSAGTYLFDNYMGEAGHGGVFFLASPPSSSMFTPEALGARGIR